MKPIKPMGVLNSVAAAECQFIECRFRQGVENLVTPQRRETATFVFNFPGNFQH
jgi:hypothetical protein